MSNSTAYARQWTVKFSSFLRTQNQDFQPWKVFTEAEAALVCEAMGEIAVFMDEGLCTDTDLIAVWAQLAHVHSELGYVAPAHARHAKALNDQFLLWRQKDDANSFSINASLMSAAPIAAYLHAKLLALKAPGEVAPVGRYLAAVKAFEQFGIHPSIHSVYAFSSIHRFIGETIPLSLDAAVLEALPPRHALLLKHGLLTADTAAAVVEAACHGEGLAPVSTPYLWSDTFLSALVLNLLLHPRPGSIGFLDVLLAECDLPAHDPATKDLAKIGFLGYPELDIVTSALAGEVAKGWSGLNPGLIDGLYSIRRSDDAAADAYDQLRSLLLTQTTTNNPPLAVDMGAGTGNAPARRSRRNGI